MHSKRKIHVPKLVTSRGSRAKASASLGTRVVCSRMVVWSGTGASSSSMGAGWTTGFSKAAAEKTSTSSVRMPRDEKVGK